MKRHLAILILLCGTPSLFSAIAETGAAVPPAPVSVIDTNRPYRVEFNDGVRVTNQVQVSKALVCSEVDGKLKYEAIEDYLRRERDTEQYIILRLMESEDPANGWIVRDENFYAIRSDKAAIFYKLDIQTIEVVSE